VLKSNFRWRNSTGESTSPGVGVNGFRKVVDLAFLFLFRFCHSSAETAVKSINKVRTAYTSGIVFPFLEDQMGIIFQRAMGNYIILEFRILVMGLYYDLVLILAC